ncbi:MAG: helix-turn-helix transcriptional regulator [Dehalococcoidia bacterium]|nr:helix-turn-helix transcriptional regulator [Dehalococcoidia bacterium]
MDGWQGAIKQARRARKWSRRQAAEAAGLGEATIEAWETGRRHPRMENLIAYCRTLGVTATERRRIVADAGYGDARHDTAEQ